MSGGDFRLDGRVALVTGGSRGLGREIAHGLARAGADVIVVSRRLDACEAAAREIAAASGRRTLGLACHVGRWDELDRLVDAAYDAFGRVDVLVNNAGMSPLYPDPAGITEELWDKVLAVNLKGPFRLAALIGTRMAAGDGGAIVNVSSAVSRHVRAHVVPYAAAKAGLNSVTATLAAAFGPRVRVNAVVPGAFMTDVSAHWDEEAFAAEAARFALRRGGRPEEIVGAVVYLASDAASYTTGALLPVDGGFV